LDVDEYGYIGFEFRDGAVSGALGVVTLTDGICKVTDAAFSNRSNGRFPGVESLEPVVSDSHSGAAACWN